MTDDVRKTMTPEQLAENRLAFERTTHHVGVDRSEWIDGKEYPHTPLVWLANGDDSYYCQYFGSRKEVEEFIGKLKAAADEAWPV